MVQVVKKKKTIRVVHLGISHRVNKVSIFEVIEVSRYLHSSKTNNKTGTMDKTIGVDVKETINSCR